MNFQYIIIMKIIIMSSNLVIKKNIVLFVK